MGLTVRVGRRPFEIVLRVCVIVLRTRPIEDKIYKIEHKIEEKIKTTPENIKLKIAENPKDVKDEEKNKLIDQQLKYMEKPFKEPYLPSDFLENVKKTLPSYAKGGIRR